MLSFGFLYSVIIIVIAVGVILVVVVGEGSLYAPRCAAEKESANTTQRKDELFWFAETTKTET